MDDSASVIFMGLDGEARVILSEHKELALLREKEILMGFSVLNWFSQKADSTFNVYSQHAHIHTTEEERKGEEKHCI